MKANQVDLKAAYEFYKNYNPQAFRDQEDAFNQEMIKKTGQKIPLKDFNEIAQIVSKLSYEDFTKFVTTNSLPPMKLTPSQMEALKAGGKYFNADMTWGDIILMVGGIAGGILVAT